MTSRPSDKKRASKPTPEHDKTKITPTRAERLEAAQPIAKERDRLRMEATRLRQERTASWYPNAHKTAEQQEELNRQFLEADQAWVKASQRFFQVLRGE